MDTTLEIPTSVPSVVPRPVPPELRAEAEVEALGECIAHLSALLTATEYQLLVLIREFDQSYGWRGGFRSCAHWLNWRTGLAMGAAREKVRVARALEELPLISEAMRTGEVSYSKVRALTRIATPETEDDLLGVARSGTAAHLERLVCAWRRADSADDCEAEEARYADRHLCLTTDADGMVVVRGRLDAEAGAALMRALDAAEQVLFEEGLDEASSKEARNARGRRPNLARRRADAIGRVAEAALAGGLDKGTRGDRYQVVVHVEASAAVAAETCECGPSIDPTRGSSGRSPTTIEGIGGVSAETSRRIACDSSLVLMTHDETGRTLDVGRRTRVIPPALRRALDHRDGGCRFPGCGIRHTDAHHLTHWADGGETRLDNLVLLCRRHHRCVHEEGYAVDLDETGTIRFRDPRGKVMTQAPPIPELAEVPFSPDAASALLAGLLDEHEITLDPMAGMPDWDGRPFDVVWALAVLMN